MRVTGGLRLAALLSSITPAVHALAANEIFKRAVKTLLACDARTEPLSSSETVELATCEIWR
jgi:hypothetical protein